MRPGPAQPDDSSLSSSQRDPLNPQPHAPLTFPETLLQVLQPQPLPSKAMSLPACSSWGHTGLAPAPPTPVRHRAVWGTEARAGALPGEAPCARRSSPLFSPGDWPQQLRHHPLDHLCVQRCGRAGRWLAGEGRARARGGGSVCLLGLTWLFPGKWVYEVLISSQGLMQVGWCTISCRFNQEVGAGPRELLCPRPSPTAPRPHLPGSTAAFSRHVRPRLAPRLPWASQPFIPRRASETRTTPTPMMATGCASGT